MKILLRHVPGAGTEYVELVGVPQVGDEIHWPERILRVHSVKWFPVDTGDGAVACLYVSTP